MQKFCFIFAKHVTRYTIYQITNIKFWRCHRPCTTIRNTIWAHNGGMPVELGMCWGRNTKLNCLEYHRDSELHIGAAPFVLLLARQEEIGDGVLDTGKVKAFRAPAGAVVEVYATTLHYAPCHLDES